MIIGMTFDQVAIYALTVYAVGVVTGGYLYWRYLTPKGTRA